MAHARSHITRAVAPTDGCLARIGAHQRGIVAVGKPASQKPLTVEASAKQSIKCQLQTTHVRAVGWEPHSSSTTTCAGKVDHELQVY